MIATYSVNMYDGNSGTSIKICEDGDGPGMLSVKVDQEHFGDIDFHMNFKDAKDFANGILRAVELIEESQK